MRFQTLGDKSEFIAVRVRNGEASATIPAGTPVVLSANGTEDGLAVVLPTSSTAAKIGAFAFGVATREMVAGRLGEVETNGVYNTAIIVHAVRAASTDSFASFASQAVGALLGIVTNANGFSVVAASTASAIVGAYLLASFATGASTVSTTANTSLVQTSARKVFLRYM